MQSEVKWWRQRVKNIFHWMKSVYWVVRCGYPARNLTVIGITGTDGKTTTSTLLYDMLRNSGVKAALLTTVSAKIGNEEIDTGLHTTNPDASVLQPLFTRMMKMGVTHVVLEVTAHGLDQYRVLGANIHIGVLTNVTREHLDDFITMERYRAAKVKLFRRVKWAVLNRDDPYFSHFRDHTNSHATVVGYGKAKLKEISPTLAGEYNLYNIGAALAVADILKLPEDTVHETVAHFAGVPGRREEVKAGQKFRVIVDFAHTPNALKSVLVQLKREVPTGKKLVVVFGCTGERDRGKRPMMGRVAAEIADMVIITSDDARSEPQDAIYAEIAAGIPDVWKDKVEKINDRRTAIHRAIEKAKPGDIVLLAGKGHEKSLAIAGREIPWSDAREAVAAIRG